MTRQCKCIHFMLQGFDTTGSNGFLSWTSRVKPGPPSVHLHSEAAVGSRSLQHMDGRSLYPATPAPAAQILRLNLGCNKARFSSRAVPRVAASVLAEQVQSLHCRPQTFTTEQLTYPTGVFALQRQLAGVQSSCTSLPCVGALHR